MHGCASPTCCRCRPTPRPTWWPSASTSTRSGRIKSLRGEFTLRGVSLPLTLTAVRFNCYTSPLLRREVCGGDFEGQFSRGAVGITHSLPFVGDTVRLLVQVEAIRQ